MELVIKFKAVCISFHASFVGKGMNLSDPTTMGKIVRPTGFSSLG